MSPNSSVFCVVSIVQPTLEPVVTVLEDVSARLAHLLDGGLAAEDAFLFLDDRRGVLSGGRRTQRGGGKSEHDVLHI